MTRAEPSNPAEDALFMRHLLLLPPQLLPLLPITPAATQQSRVLEETKMRLMKCVVLHLVFLMSVCCPVRCQSFSESSERTHFVRAQQPGAPHGGVAGQGLAARARPTAPATSRVAGAHQGSPSPTHGAPRWGRGRAEARLGRGPVGGPGSARPMAGQGRAVGSWRPALLPAAASLGQGLMVLGAEMGSWAVGRG